MTAPANARANKWRKLGFSSLLGGLAGFAGAAAILGSAESGWLGTLTASQEIALLVALMYLLMGLAVGFGVVSPRMGATFLNVEDADELREERDVLVPSAIGCVALALGVAALALSGSSSLVPPVLALALFGLSLALSVWLSLRSVRRADELMRDVMRDGAAVSFYLAFAGIAGWAVLAHLGLAPALAMLDVVTLFYALTLVGCFLAAGKRGMLVR